MPVKDEERENRDFFVGAFRPSLNQETFAEIPGGAACRIQILHERKALFLEFFALSAKNLVCGARKKAVLVQILHDFDAEVPFLLGQPHRVYLPFKMLVQRHPRVCVRLKCRLKPVALLVGGGSGIPLVVGKPVEIVLSADNLIGQFVLLFIDLKGGVPFGESVDFGPQVLGGKRENLQRLNLPL